MLSDYRVRMIVREELTRFPVKASLVELEKRIASENNSLTNEGVVLDTIMGVGGDVLVNTLKSIPGAVAEYGLASTVAGAPIAPFVESVIDSLIVVADVAFGVKTVMDVISQIDELKKLYDTVAEHLSGGLNTKRIYFAVNKILSLIYKSKFGARIIEKIRDSIKTVISKITRVLASIIRFCIPDAITGSITADAVIVAVRGALAAGTSNVYDVLAKAFNAIPADVRSYVTEPGRLVTFMNKAFSTVVSFFKELAEQLENSSTLKAVIYGGAAGLVIKKLGPAGIKKSAEMLEERQPEVALMASQTVKVLIPFLFASVAALQSIYSGDYKTESLSPIGTDVQSAISSDSQLKGMMETKVYLRALERDIQLLESKFLRISKDKSKD